MSRLRFHVYVPEYRLQGPTFESERPLTQRQEQKLVDDFYKWLKGDQSKLKAQVAAAEVTTIVAKGPGFVSVTAIVLRNEIIKKFNQEPREDLTIEQLKKLKEGKLFAARFFK